MFTQTQKGTYEDAPHATSSFCDRLEHLADGAEQAATAYAIEGTGAGTHTIRVDHSALFGEDFGIRLSSGNYNAYVGASLVQGGGNASSGIIRCVSSYKEDYTAINATCN